MFKQSRIPSQLMRCATATDISLVDSVRHERPGEIIVKCEQFTHAIFLRLKVVKCSNHVPVRLINSLRTGQNRRTNVLINLFVRALERSCTGFISVRYSA